MSVNYGRLSKGSKEAEQGTRCTFVLPNGEVCNRFPSWKTGKKKRRCEEHRDEH